MFLTVTYALPVGADGSLLHTELFVKIPWEPEMPIRSELSLGFMDGDGLELSTYVFLEHLLPVHVPKLYFADLDRKSTNYVLVTERIPFADKGTEDCRPFQVLPPCGKYVNALPASPSEAGNAFSARVVAPRRKSRVRSKHTMVMVFSGTPHGPNLVV